MEYFDVLDHMGGKTGRVLPKGSRLDPGEYYLGVHCYLCDAAGRFLVQQRAWDKEFLPGGWDIHAGHVVAGESSREAVRREVAEEVGILLPCEEFHLAGRVEWENLPHFADVYFARIEGAPDKGVLQAGEVLGVKLVSATEMRRMVEGMADYRPARYCALVLEELAKWSGGGPGFSGE